MRKPSSPISRALSLALAVGIGPVVAQSQKATPPPYGTDIPVAVRQTAFRLLAEAKQAAPNLPPAARAVVYWNAAISEREISEVEPAQEPWVHPDLLASYEAALQIPASGEEDGPEPRPGANIKFRLETDPLGELVKHAASWSEALALTRRSDLPTTAVYVAVLVSANVGGHPNAQDLAELTDECIASGSFPYWAIGRWQGVTELRPKLVDQGMTAAAAETSLTGLSEATSFLDVVIHDYPEHRGQALAVARVLLIRLAQMNTADKVVLELGYRLLQTATRTQPDGAAALKRRYPQFRKLPTSALPSSEADGTSEQLLQRAARARDAATRFRLLVDGALFSHGTAAGRDAAREAATMLNQDDSVVSLNHAMLLAGIRDLNPPADLAWRQQIATRTLELADERAQAWNVSFQAATPDAQTAMAFDFAFSFGTGALTKGGDIAAAYLRGLDEPYDNVVDRIEAMPTNSPIRPLLLARMAAELLIGPEGGD